MHEILSQFDKSTEFIEKFLEMDNSNSIVLSLYKGDKTRLARKYPDLTFTIVETVDNTKKMYKYLIQRNT